MNRIIRSFIIPGLILAAAFLVTIFLVRNPPQLESAMPEQALTAVNVRAIVPQNRRLTVRSEGTVIPRSETEIVPEVSGRAVWVSPALLPGGTFAGGEPLLRIDARDYHTAVTRARAQLNSARASLELAEYEYQRQVDLDARKLTSGSILDQARREATRAAAMLTDAEAALEQARRDLARTELRAPFSGRVRREQVDTGQFISRGHAVASVYATDFVEVRLPVADHQLRYLDINLEAGRQIDPEAAPAVRFTADFAGRQREWRGSIVRTEAEIDERSRMVYLVARVENAMQEIPLPVGLFVNAGIEGTTVDNILVIDRSSLYNGRVAVVDSRDRLHLRRIDILRIQGDEVIFRGGLQPGDRVCVSQLQTIVEGTRVNPLAGPPAALSTADNATAQ